MFDKIIVDDFFKKQITSAIKGSTLSHAIILEGADADIRLLVAKEIAQAIVCSGNEKPCMECKNCKKALADSHPDIHFLSKDNSATTIKVDEIRELRRKAQLVPNDSKKAVFIISEAQFMGVQAQNALLKIFEEPSEYVCFILTCETKASLLETIISRGASYQISPPVVSGCSVSTEASELADELIDSLCFNEEFVFLKKTAVFQKNKDLFSETLSAMKIILRDGLIHSYKKNYYISEKLLAAEKLSKCFSSAKIIRFIENIDSIEVSLKANANFNLLTTRFCSSFYQIKLSNI
ncbi:MAG: hypothetical protein IJ262_00990 [Clostridia bacterium]|nr:hypothetical protein [Clostridia bacterium]